MTYAFFSLADRYRRLRARHIGPVEKRARAIGVARANWLLRSMRTSPELADTAGSNDLLGQISTAWRNRRIRRRWVAFFSADGLDEAESLQGYGIAATIARLQPVRWPWRPGLHVVLPLVLPDHPHFTFRNPR